MRKIVCYLIAVILFSNLLSCHKKNLSEDQIKDNVLNYIIDKSNYNQLFFRGMHIKGWFVIIDKPAEKYFSSHRVYEIIDKLPSTPHVYAMAYDNNGCVYDLKEGFNTADKRNYSLMPNNFNALIREENVQLKNIEDALSVAQLCVSLTYGSSYYKVRFLSSYKDVDISEGEEIILKEKGCYRYRTAHDKSEYFNALLKEIERYKNVIVSPAVTMKGEEYEVDFFTWKAAGGDLRKWVINVKKNGECAGESRLIATPIGAYDLPR